MHAEGWIIVFQVTQLKNTTTWLPCSSRQLQKSVFQARPVESHSRRAAVQVPVEVKEAKGKRLDSHPGSPQLYVLQHISMGMYPYCEELWSNWAVFWAGNSIISLVQSNSWKMAWQQRIWALLAPSISICAITKTHRNTGVTGTPSSKKHN